MAKIVQLKKPALTSGLIVIAAAVPLWLLIKGIQNVGWAWETQEPTSTIQAPQYPLMACNKSMPEEFKESFVPERIVIKNSEIDLQVKSVPLEKGTWKVHSGVANYAEGTSPVSSAPGNVGIYAHDKQNGFARIKQLNPGDQIQVYGGNYVATYQVSASEIAGPKAVDVLYPTEDPQLTLITCDGIFSKERYIISAKLMFIEELNCNETTN